VDESVHLANDHGHVIESWELPEGVLSIVAPGRRAYVLTGGAAHIVFRLDPHGQRTLVMQGSGDDGQVSHRPSAIAAVLPATKCSARSRAARFHACCPR
jgi:hypothetical protein